MLAGAHAISRQAGRFYPQASLRPSRYRRRPRPPPPPPGSTTFRARPIWRGHPSRPAAVLRGTGQEAEPPERRPIPQGDELPPLLCPRTAASPPPPSPPPGPTRHPPEVATSPPRSPPRRQSGPVGCEGAAQPVRYLPRGGRRPAAGGTCTRRGWRRPRPAAPPPPATAPAPGPPAGRSAAPASWARRAAGPTDPAPAANRPAGAPRRPPSSGPAPPTRNGTAWRAPASAPGEPPPLGRPAARGPRPASASGRRLEAAQGRHRPPPAAGCRVLGAGGERRAASGCCPVRGEGYFGLVWFLIYLFRCLFTRAWLRGLPEFRLGLQTVPTPGGLPKLGVGRGVIPAGAYSVSGLQKATPSVR